MNEAELFKIAADVDLVSPPKPVGGYYMNPKSGHGDIGFMLIHKPNWFHRKMVRLVLGWEWRDA